MINTDGIKTTHISPSPWSIAPPHGDMYDSHEGEMAGTLFEPRTKLEVTFISILAAIFDKRDWPEKYKLYLKTWLKEAHLPFAFDNKENKLWFEKALDYCSKESKILSFDRCGIPHVFCKWFTVTRRKIWKKVISNYIRQDSKLKQIRIHPNSNTTMLDIVHPCWHATRHKLTKSWTFVPAEFNIDKKQFQNIPNLHPQFTKLYELVAELALEALPLLSKCLETHTTEDYCPLPFAGAKSFGSSWFLNLYDSFSACRETLSDEYRQTARIRQVKAMWPEKCRVEVAVEDEDYSISVKRKFQKPEKELLFPLPISTLDFPTDLQMYVKIASIQLTPTNPKYLGSSWHVEGVAEEHIVATAIYYFEETNVTSSNLEFRVPVCEPPYEQSDSEGINELYDFGWNGIPLQQLGSVQTSRDRLIVFPNCYHHRVPPFELLDQNKNGARSFCVLWLVDPRIKIERKEGTLVRSWIKYELNDFIATEVLQELIAEYVSPFDEKFLLHSVEEQASQRKLKINKLNSSTESFRLSLCEH